MNRIDDRPAVARVDDREAAEASALPVDLDALADLLAEVLAAEGVTGAAEASLQLVSAATIAALNVEHLGGSGPTDVLSFPIDGAVPVDSVPVDSLPVDWLVGDVLVCPEVAAAQASGHAGDLKSELALLVTHGGLHLCGWDHGDDTQRDAMWARERELLERFGASPVRDPWSDGEQVVEPVVGEQVDGEQVVEPVVGEPVVGEQVVGEQVVGEPVVGEQGAAR